MQMMIELGCGIWELFALLLCIIVKLCLFLLRRASSRAQHFCEMLSENGNEHSRGDNGHNSGAGDRGARTPPTIEHRSVKCGADAVAGAGDNNTQQALPSGGGARPRSQARNEASKNRHQDTKIIEQALSSRGGTQTEQ